MSKLLVVVDMQNDFVDGSLGSKEAQAIVPALVRKTREEILAGTDVVFTRDTHQANYLETQEGKKLPVLHCIKDSEGWNLIPQLRPLAEDRTIINKNAFGSTMLAHYVSKNSFTEVELIGLCTDICVISNAMIIKAAAPEAVVRVYASCCAGVTAKSHLNALEAMKMCQIEIAD